MAEPVHDVLSLLSLKILPNFLIILLQLVSLTMLLQLPLLLPVRLLLLLLLLLVLLQQTGRVLLLLLQLLGSSSVPQRLCRHRVLRTEISREKTETRVASSICRCMRCLPLQQKHLQQQEQLQQEQQQQEPL